MKLGIRGHYALIALLDLMEHGTDHPVPLSEIAARQNLPIQYLEQIFSKLRRRGMVTSSRGNLGGYTLSLDPRGINVLDIMCAVEEHIQTKKCVHDSMVGCQGQHRRCPTHHLWQGLEEHIRQYLKAVNLADLSDRKSFFGQQALMSQDDQSSSTDSGGIFSCL